MEGELLGLTFCILEITIKEIPWRFLLLLQFLAGVTGGLFLAFHLHLLSDEVRLISILELLYQTSFTSNRVKLRLCLT